MKSFAGPSQFGNQCNKDNLVCYKPTSLTLLVIFVGFCVCVCWGGGGCVYLLLFLFHFVSFPYNREYKIMSLLPRLLPL